MKAKLFGVIAAVTFVAGLPSARAAIVDVTYTGMVTSITDQANTFHGAGVGSLFQIAYRFDTTQGYTISSPTENLAYGGSCCGNSSPSLGATVTVNNVTGPAIAGNLEGNIFGYNDPSQQSSEQYHFTEEYNWGADNIYNKSYAQSTFYNNAPVSTIPASITSPFTYSIQPGDVQFMRVSYYIYDGNTGTLTASAYIRGSLLQ